MTAHGLFDRVVDEAFNEVISQDGNGSKSPNCDEEGSEREDHVMHVILEPGTPDPTADGRDYPR